MDRFDPLAVPLVELEERGSVVNPRARPGARGDSTVRLRRRSGASDSGRKANA
jgi:hypothetical protein